MASFSFFKAKRPVPGLLGLGISILSSGYLTSRPKIKSRVLTRLLKGFFRDRNVSI